MEVPSLSWRNLTFGLQRILFGVMKKMVVADRLNILIQNVFTNYEAYDGFVTAIAVVCYTVQLYMDFSGTMDLVIGTAQIFGVKLPEISSGRSSPIPYRNSGSAGTLRWAPGSRITFSIR